MTDHKLSKVPDVMLPASGWIRSMVGFQNDAQRRKVSNGCRGEPTESRCVHGRRAGNGSMESNAGSALGRAEAICSGKRFGWSANARHNYIGLGCGEYCASSIPSFQQPVSSSRLLIAGWRKHCWLSCRNSSLSNKMGRNGSPATKNTGNGVRYRTGMPAIIGSLLSCSDQKKCLSIISHKQISGSFMVNIFINADNCLAFPVNPSKDYALGVCSGVCTRSESSAGNGRGQFFSLSLISFLIESVASPMMEGAGALGNRCSSMRRAV